MQILRFLILLALPILEILLFVLIGSEIGVWSVLGLILLGIVVGVMILRRGIFAGMHTMFGSSAPSNLSVFAHGGLKILAAILLILPGFMTDILGLCFLIPFFRRFILETMIFAFFSSLLPRIIVDMAQNIPRDFSEQEKNIIMEGVFEVENTDSASHMGNKRE